MYFQSTGWVIILLFSQAAGQGVDRAEDEVDLDLVVIDQVAVDPDPYHQQNIKSNVILAIAKIQHDRDGVFNLGRRTTEDEFRRIFERYGRLEVNILILYPISPIIFN